MSAQHSAQPARHSDWFMRAAAAIGDLGDPFYSEERQRDVWNEASAVGFQGVLLLLLIGTVRATPSNGSWSGDGWGMVVGAALGVVGLLWRRHRVRRSGQRTTEPDFLRTAVANATA